MVANCRSSADIEMRGRAQSRLFHLQHEIDKSLRERILDPEVEKALTSAEAERLLWPALFMQDGAGEPPEPVSGMDSLVAHTIQCFENSHVAHRLLRITLSNRNSLRRPPSCNPGRQALLF